jgi:hypothetical protein
LKKEPKYWTAPVSLFDAIINTLAFFGQFSKGAEDAAELARIGKYYAVEDMLTTEPTVTVRPFLIFAAYNLNMLIIYKYNRPFSKILSYLGEVRKDHAPSALRANCCRGTGVRSLYDRAWL